jgi:hypothetical protein
MTDQEIVLKLRDNVVHLLNRSIDEQLMLDVIAAMLGALIETHPDKAALHARFSRIFQSLGGPDRAVKGMAQGLTGSGALLAGLSQSIGRELP